jgi:uncharacterized NAD-dependent epimerase/dehydratase family protein
MTEIKLPYLIFLADAQDDLHAKTGFGVRDWRPDACLGQWSLPSCGANLGFTEMTPDIAVAQGAASLLIGVAPFGGRVQENWIPHLVAALEAGLDIVSGMHSKLEDVPEIAEAAKRLGRTLHNVRHAPRSYVVANGIKRTGKRLLTVGTDCALGKKYTALALTRALTERGHKATFRATGQTGIMISGGGIAIDAIVSDFIAGAAEWLSPDNDADHWDIVEGQGSLYHPAYSGVSLGLLHGTQPDALILCHDPLRTHIDGYPGYPIAPLKEAIETHVLLARRVNANARFVGVALNTSKLGDDERCAAFAKAEAETGLPAFDPLLGPLDAVLTQMEAI